ncbi:MAG: redoxin domain-containing protein [Myxococcales bacterium]|nr:redoxin domain-containing protein [Myxococcales bacterium]
MERIFMVPSHAAKQAPPLSMAHWLNTDGPLDLRGMEGRVVVLCAFRMDCRESLRHGLPQAARIREAFDPRDVEVIGMHPVLDQPQAMGALTLASFLLEYDVRIPVGLDARTGSAANDSVLTTMESYGITGTPSLVIIDRQGCLRAHVLGHPADMLVGATIATLVAEKKSRPVVLGRRPRPLTPMDTAFAEGYASHRWQG